MTLYDKIKEKADAMKKSISSIEAEAGVANGTIAGWKTGRPYAETLKKVAEVIGERIEDLI